MSALEQNYFHVSEPLAPAAGEGLGSASAGAAAGDEGGRRVSGISRENTVVNDIVVVPHDHSDSELRESGTSRKRSDNTNDSFGSSGFGSTQKAPVETKEEREIVAPRSSGSRSLEVRKKEATPTASAPPGPEREQGS